MTAILLMDSITYPAGKSSVFAENFQQLFVRAAAKNVEKGRKDGFAEKPAIKTNILMRKSPFLIILMLNFQRNCFILGKVF